MENISLHVCRPYAVDVNTLCYVTKHETENGQKSGYCSAILSGKKDRGLWSISTVEQFVSSFLTSARSNFTFLPRMHKVSTGPKAHRAE